MAARTHVHGVVLGLTCRRIDWEGLVTWCLLLFLEHCLHCSGRHEITCSAGMRDVCRLVVPSTVNANVSL